MIINFHDVDPNIITGDILNRIVAFYINNIYFRFFISSVTYSKSSLSIVVDKPFKRISDTELQVREILKGNTSFYGYTIPVEVYLLSEEIVDMSSELDEK